jgi:hypothetical protein
VAFFVNIGLSDDPTLDNFIIACMLALFMLMKVALFFIFLVKTKLKARTSFRVSLSLANYSEFGLIVGAIGVSSGWMSNEWLITIAIALAITFVIASSLNVSAHILYARYAPYLKRWEAKNLLRDEKALDVSQSCILVFGMGRVGTGVYKDLNYHYPKQVTGIEFDVSVYQKHEQAGRNVLYADVMDQDFWHRIDLANISIILLNLPDLRKNIFTINQIKEKNYQGHLAAIARYDEDIILLKKAGADEVYNFYSEAGLGFAEHIRHNLINKKKFII